MTVLLGAKLFTGKLYPAWLGFSAGCFFKSYLDLVWAKISHILYYLSKHHGNLGIDESETSGKEARCYIMVSRAMFLSSIIFLRGLF